MVSIYKPKMKSIELSFIVYLIHKLSDEMITYYHNNMFYHGVKLVGCFYKVDLLSGL